MRIAKKLSIILMLIPLLLTSPLRAFASEGNGSGQGGSIGAGHSNTTGFSQYRTGYLIYITDVNGNVKATPKFVPFQSAPAANVTRIFKTRVTNSTAYSDYGGNIKDATSGGTTVVDYPPLDVVGGGVYGSRFKNWCITKQGTKVGASILIGNLWGEGTWNAFIAEDQYLCIEAVMWASPIGSTSLMIAGTSYTLAQKWSQYNSRNIRPVIYGRLPRCGFLEYAWAGCTAPTIHGGQEPVSELTRPGNGYGIMCS